MQRCFGACEATRGGQGERGELPARAEDILAGKASLQVEQIASQGALRPRGGHAPCRMAPRRVRRGHGPSPPCAAPRPHLPRCTRTRRRKSAASVHASAAATSASPGSPPRRSRSSPASRAAAIPRASRTWHVHGVHVTLGKAFLAPLVTAFPVAFGMAFPGTLGKPFAATLHTASRPQPRERRAHERIVLRSRTLARSHRQRRALQCAPRRLGQPRLGRRAVYLLRPPPRKGRACLLLLDIPHRGVHESSAPARAPTTPTAPAPRSPETRSPCIRRACGAARPWCDPPPAPRPAAGPDPRRWPDRPDAPDPGACTAFRRPASASACGPRRPDRTKSEDPKLAIREPRTISNLAAIRVTRRDGRGTRSRIRPAVGPCAYIRKCPMSIGCRVRPA